VAAFSSPAEEGAGLAELRIPNPAVKNLLASWPPAAAAATGVLANRGENEEEASRVDVEHPDPRILRNIMVAVERKKERKKER